MMVTDGIPSSMAKNSWNSFGPCCRSSDKEGAHMKRTWKVLLVCVVAVAALAGYFFLLPAPAGGEDFQLLEVRQDGRDLTASLRPEQLADLEATMRGASRFRWKNPMGVILWKRIPSRSWVPMGNPSSWWAVRGALRWTAIPCTTGRPCWRRFRTSSHPNSFCL